MFSVLMFQDQNSFVAICVIMGVLVAVSAIACWRGWGINT